MADDPRDKRRVHTPPAGVRAQIAPDDWDKPSQHHTPVNEQTLRETPVEAIDRRIRETKNTTITTLDRVNELRKETREDINRVHEKIDNTGQKLDAVIVVVGDLREAVGKQEGQNELIIGMLDEAKKHRENSEHVVTTTKLAEIQVDTTRQLTDLEVQKTRALTDIDEEKKSKALKRKLVEEFALKVIASAGVIWAIVSVSLSKCG